MLDDSNAPRHLMRWDHSSDQRLGHDVITASHRLAELPAFSDEGLARLIDRYPADAMQVTTMGENPAHRSQLQYGQIGDHSGRAWIEMIRRGRLCLRLSDLSRHDKPLRDILRRLSDELRECQPGLRMDSGDADLRIASPYVLDYLHVDIEPALSWQIRGERTILTYPVGDPVVPSCVLEALVATQDRQPLYFEPAFDENATTHALCPGDVVGFPQYTPYRVNCGGTLSIFLTTRCHTHESQRANEVQRGNHLLRHWGPRRDYATSTTGPRAFTKMLLARMAPRRTDDSTELAKAVSFSVDPNAYQCVGAVQDANEPSDQSKSRPNTRTIPVFPPGRGASTTLSALGAKT